MQIDVPAQDLVAQLGRRIGELTVENTALRLQVDQLEIEVTELQQGGAS